MLLSTLLGCNQKTNNNNTQEEKKENTPSVTSKEDFGVFLGLQEGNYQKLLSFKKVAIEIEEFSSSIIDELKSNDIEIYAYLSVGSLEKYRPYYNEFKNYTFMDYDNWPHERWIDVSQKSWQDHIKDTASSFKNMGANGLFLDNFDVYYIASEEYECSTSFKEGIYEGCKTILSNLSTLEMSLLLNSGSTFLERLDEEHDSLIDKVDWYAQESVFSSIIDYENNIFGKQNEEDHNYYLEIIEMMKEKSSILLIEYTEDQNLIEEIESYCKSNNFSCYITNRVNLD